MTRRVAVVPHTHWDREWYEPYQTFRLQLVELLDDLLDMLDRDSAFTHFQLDGQMAAVDDYLEIRPEVRERLIAFGGQGRVSMGPWYALPDEFLVSGETLIRNLQLGFARADQFGGAMQVGYLPDMFGHVAQMPQVLALFGLTDAVVWRGVPSAVERDSFWWEGPDGSRVRAEYLPQGYGNGARLLDDPKDLVERIRAFEDEYDSMLTGDLLWMNGTDHQMPSDTLTRVLSEANSIQDDYRLEITSLATYLARGGRDDLATWSGELRSGARANLLMGVASNRVDVKQAGAAAERVLEREAEPMAALFLDSWPGRLLDAAWLDVIRNSAHDSVCACSHDEVCDAVNHRYHEATRIGEGLRDRAVQAAVDRLAQPGGVVVNPSASARSGIVELDLPGEGEPAGLQLITQHPPEMILEFASAEARQIVKAMLDWEDGWHSAEVSLGEDALDVTIHKDDSQPERVVSRSVVSRMETLDEAGELPVRIRMTMPPVRTVLTHVTDVPGYGWQRWEPAELSVEPVSARGTTLANGLVTVEVDIDDGTFSIDGRAGLGRLVDGGDTGDTYNYNPPGNDELVDMPDRVSVSVLESGPVRARLAVDAAYTWPASAMGDRRAGEVTTSVRTTLELRAGEDIVRVQVDLDNQARDHRLRAHFPLPSPADRSSAECAFTTVERGLEAEGGPSERALSTYPSRRFVRAGGLTVVHDGLLEYELVDIADGRAGALALTLLRCTGMLSQIPMPYRPLPAGPLTPLEGPQMAGRQRLRYALHVGDRDPYELADEVLVPLRVAVAPGTGDQPDAGTALEVRGGQVSALRRNAQGRLCIRVFNPTHEATTVSISGRSGSVVDLLGAELGPFDGTIDLGPHAIATVALDQL